MSDRIFLVRHGQTEWNRLGLAQGHTDTPLDEDGHAQARALGARFRGTHLDWLVSSDLQRSRQTAEAIRSEVEFDPDLRERGFGEWEGLPYIDFRDRLAAIAGTHEDHPPGGESFMEVWHRVERAYLRILARPGTGMVVTHGGTAGILLAQLLRATPETAFGFRFGNTGVCVLERRNPPPYRLLTYNDTSHAEGTVLGGDLSGAHTR